MTSDSVESQTPETEPTHLLTMTRGTPEAVPPHAMRALRAMGVTTIEIEGKGVGLIFSGEIPNFLKMDPFHLAPYDAPPRPVAEPKPEPEVSVEEIAEDLPDEDLSAEADAPPEPTEAEAPAPEETPEEIPMAEPDPDMAEAAEPSEDGDPPVEEEAVHNEAPPVAGNLPEPEEEAPADDTADLPDPETAAAEAQTEDNAAPLAEETPPESPVAAEAPPAPDGLAERLDRIEALLSAQTAAPEPAPTTPDEGRIDKLAADLARMLEQQYAMTERLSALDGLVQRVETGLADLAKRPAPKLDLTAQHRSFAAFGASLASFQKRIETLADHVGSNFAAQTAHLTKMVDGLGTATANAGDTVEIEALSQIVTALSDQLSAAREETGATESLLKAVHELHETQDRLAAMLGQILEMPDTSIHAAQEQFLRDVRLIIAELLAEGRRASVA